METFENAWLLLFFGATDVMAECEVEWFSPEVIQELLEIELEPETSTATGASDQYEIPVYGNSPGSYHRRRGTFAIEQNWCGKD